MRRLAPVLAASFVLTGGCRIHRHHAEETNPEGNQLVSVVNVADPRTATQLTRGFWDLEHDSWRWTAKSWRSIPLPASPTPPMC